MSTGDPDPCPLSNESKKNNIIASKKLNKSGKENIYAGLLLEKEGKIDEAIIFYKGLIMNDDHVVFALTNLAKIKNKYKRSELLDYFESILSSENKYFGKIKNLIGNIYLQDNRFDDAISAFNNVINRSSTNQDVINARFEKLFGYLHIKNNIQMASQILTEIKGMNLTDRGTLARIQMAEDIIKSANNRTLYKNSTIVKNIPKSYDLSQNFPNPFNPSTTIRYQIPKPGLVTLKVYDILGREVTTLVNENKIEGSYDFSFNASNSPAEFTSISSE